MTVVGGGSVNTMGNAPVGSQVETGKAGGKPLSKFLARSRFSGLPIVYDPGPGPASGHYPLSLMNSATLTDFRWDELSEIESDPRDRQPRIPSRDHDAPTMPMRRNSIG